VLVSVCLAVAVVTGALLVRLRPARAVEARSSVVAVLPFSYDGDRSSAYLSDGIVRLLSAGLNGAGQLRTVDPHVLLTAAERQGLRPGDADGARTLSTRLGAGLLVQGQIVEAGGRLRVTAALSVGAADRREVTVEGSADRLLDLVDALTAKLLSVYSAERGARLTGLAALTTQSLPALKAYLEGEARLHDGQYGEASDAFGRAVAIDTAFALAHFRLATAARWLNNYATADSARARAHRLGSRLPRREQLLVEAWTLDEAGDPLAAERLYRTVLGERPDDVEAWSQLGEVLFHWGPSVGRPVTDAREPFERVIAYTPGDAGALIHLARLAARRGDRDALAALVRRIAALRPAEDRTLETSALTAAALHDPAEMARLTARMADAGGDVVLRTATTVAVFGRDLDAAWSLTGALVGATREAAWRAKGRLFRAELEMARGRRRAAQQELAGLDRFPAQMQYLSGTEYQASLATLPFLPLAPAEARASRATLVALPRIASIVPGSAGSDAAQAIYGAHQHYLTGLLSARAGDTVAALAEAHRLESYVGSDGDRAMARRLARGVRARVAWAAGRPAEALRLLPEPGVWPDRTLPRPENYPKDDERFLYAELLRATGRSAEALRWYATFPDPNGSDLAYLAPSHLRRAEIFEALGRRDSAAVHYRQFVALWRACDPELRPFVQHAARRLGVLGGGGRTSGD
jgi:tetratricopeptide (TPR) repeat protein